MVTKHTGAFMFVFSDGFMLLSVLCLTLGQASQVGQNITTNEMTNAYRYTYLKGPDSRYFNPYDHGCIKNCADFWIQGENSDVQKAWKAPQPPNAFFRRLFGGAGAERGKGGHGHVHSHDGCCSHDRVGEGRRGRGATWQRSLTQWGGDATSAVPGSNAISISGLDGAPGRLASNGGSWAFEVDQGKALGGVFWHWREGKGEGEGEGECGSCRVSGGEQGISLMGASRGIGVPMGLGRSRRPRWASDKDSASLYSTVLYCTVLYCDHVMVSCVNIIYRTAQWAITLLIRPLHVVRCLEMSTCRTLQCNTWNNSNVEYSESQY